MTLTNRKRKQRISVAITEEHLQDEDTRDRLAVEQTVGVLVQHSMVSLLVLGQVLDFRWTGAIETATTQGCRKYFAL